MDHKTLLSLSRPNPTKRYPSLQQRNVRVKYHEIIAYDFETTRIKAGTPEVLYLTAYGKDFFLSTPVESIHHLKALLIHHFLTDENKGKYFVAWNGNKFDVYFVIQALLTVDPDYLQRPYLTRNNQLRGVGIIEFPDWDDDRERINVDWQFLDGMAMTGIHTKLKSFIQTFAPDYSKLDIGLADGVEFDCNNPDHVKYADRDSEGLYHAMINCNQTINQLTGLWLTPTIGNLGIKYLQTKMPKKKIAKRVREEILFDIEDYLYRGGYCFLAYPYKGPIWKYDINQAYAAAMRDCALPCGTMMDIYEYIPDLPGIYRVRATHSHSPYIPFYYKPVVNMDAGERIEPLWSRDKILETWLTSVEVEQLISEGWDVEVIDGCIWEDSFNLADMVNELEKFRSTDPDGPAGPIGTMAKALGNNSYGKLGERLEGNDYVIAREQPPGYIYAEVENPERDFLFVKVGVECMRPYHKPQIAAFITAHVRMQVRRAALLGGPHWVYADTDCVVYRKPIEGLDIHPTRYGAWKEELAGVPYMLILKKVYASVDGKSIYAKGMRKAGLTLTDMENWYSGNAPKRKQLHKRNIIHFLSGFDMYVTRIKTGQVK